MNRALFAAFGIWPSADGTAKGRLRKNAMTAEYEARAITRSGCSELQEESSYI